LIASNSTLNSLQSNSEQKVTLNAQNFHKTIFDFQVLRAALHRVHCRRPFAEGGYGTVERPRRAEEVQGGVQHLERSAPDDDANSGELDEKARAGNTGLQHFILAYKVDCRFNFTLHYLALKSG